MWENSYAIWRQIQLILQFNIMGYAQRFIIGVFLIVSAYDIYEFSSLNNHFLTEWMPKIPDMTGSNQKTSNLCQTIIAILVSCSGVALIIGYGLILAVVSQSLLTFFSIFDQTKGTTLNLMYWIILNVAALAIIVINHRTIDSQDVVCPRQKQELAAKQERQ